MSDSPRPEELPTAPRRTARSKKHRDRHRSFTSASMAAQSGLKSRYCPLSDAEVQSIHRAATELLENVGMAAPTERVLEVALARGCILGDDQRLRFPATLVEDLLANAAREFVVHARDPQFDFVARNDQLNLCTGGAAVKMLDSQSRQYRASLLNDIYDLARVADTLPNIQWFARPVVATDIPDVFDLDVNTLFACAAGTQKHIATSIVQGDHVKRLLPMLDALAGGEGQFRQRPFCTVHATTVVSPLTFAQDSLDVACEAVDIGMPIHCQTGPQAGATAPAALAGTLVQCCAEGLASLCVINMLQAGYPVVLGNWAFVSDLRTGAFSGGSAEQALLGAASGQMSAFYGIPGGMGAGMTDSKVPDNQAGYEKALTMMLASLSGGGFVFESAGMLASLLGCSLEALVIDDDMLSSLRRVARGIEVTEETLSVDVITETVSGPGHFLGAAQTLELMESEFVYPQQADRLTPDDWQEAGAQDSWARATVRVNEIIESHIPYYVNAEADTWIRDNYQIHLPPKS